MESYLGFSAIYDKLIKEDIDYEEIAEFILNEAKDRNNYLDLGCGTGNLSAIIGTHFNETYLVDLSPDMLTQAEDKFNELGIRHRLFAISMSDFSFDQTFSLITSSIDALNYLLTDEELQSFFAHVYDHLEKDGVFIFDINSAYKLEEILGNNNFVYTEDDLVYTWENYLEDDILEMYLNFFIKTGKLYERVEEVHYEKVYTLEEILFQLDKAGFKEIKLSESYGQGEIRKETERITFTVRKEVNHG
ncbi:MAG: class I SAM-dependent methyltransferase [Clostridiaceae bacterium]